MNIDDLRIDAMREVLGESNMAPPPVRPFDARVAEAAGSRFRARGATAPAAVGGGSRPAAHRVRAGEFDARGVAFFTGRLSREGRRFRAKRPAALRCFRSELGRRARVEGAATRLELAAAACFAGRRRALRRGARTSPQSRRSAGRTALDARIAGVEPRHRGVIAAGPGPSPRGRRPPIPDATGFRQGRASRAHDRIRCARARERAGARIVDRPAP